MQYKVKTGALQDYSRELIRYAIQHNKTDIVNLLQANGIKVNADVDDKTLHAMVLKAMVSSKSFKDDLIGLLSDIAAEGQHKRKYKGLDGKWYNQDGTQTNSNTSSQNLTISNDTLNGLISKGIDTVVNKLINGGGGAIDSNIKAEVNTPAPAPPKSNTLKTVVITTVVLAGVGTVLWYILKKKK